MADKKAKKKVGRPRAIIDWEQVSQLAISGANVTGIAHEIGVSIDALRNRAKDEGIIGEGTDFPTLSAYLQEKQKVLASNILKKQVEVAFGTKEGSKPNATMLIWLGKNLCGQTDKQEVRHDGQLGIGSMEIAAPPAKIEDEN